ncbi:MAG: ribonuclease III [Sumerlaeia bacterium]
MDQERRTALTNFLSSINFSDQLPDLNLVHLALIHRSWFVENDSQGPGDNERLEFLGDAVIGLATTEYLYRKMPNEDEGTLSQLRAAMVSRKILGEIALGLEIGKILMLGVGEESSGGRKRHSTLGSALEALCGALYLSLSLKEIEPFLLNVIVQPAEALAARRVAVDYKSQLQEWSQGQGRGLPRYKVIQEQGPDHNKSFVTQVWLDQELLAEGKGSRKKNAENDAARLALDFISQKKQSES